MPSSMAHYAVGAAGLHLFDMPRRRLALLGLWSIAPDLDVVPAIGWTLLSPHLPLGADALRLGAHLFGHRGFSHTFLAALLAASLVWSLTRDRQHGLAVGLVWGLHVVLDTLTDWSTMPLWPLSEQSFMIPLVTGLDPLLTVLSIGTMVALLGPIATDKLGWPGGRGQLRLEAWARRWGRPLAYASIGAVAFSAAMIGWTAAGTDAGAVVAANAPRTAALDAPVEADVDDWTVTTRWAPWSEGTSRQVAYVANATEATPPGLVDRAECVFDSLGPFAPVDRPVWRLHQAEGSWYAHAVDLTRNATGTEGPAVQIHIQGDAIEGAWVTGGDPSGEDPVYRSTLPSALWEEASCL